MITEVRSLCENAVRYQQGSLSLFSIFSPMKIWKVPDESTVLVAFPTVAPLGLTDNKDFLLSQNKVQLTASSCFLTFSVRFFTSLKKK